MMMLPDGAHARDGERDMARSGSQRSVPAALMEAHDTPRLPALSAERGVSAAAASRWALKLGGC
jgi:hypothetical protein